MSNSNQHQIHDIFFRKSMEQPFVAIDFLKSYLPKEILSRIDLSTLKQQKESFIEKDIGQGIVDCLYQVESLVNDNGNGDNKTDQHIDNSDTGNRENKLGYIYCLLEHQTKPDRFMAFILIKYMISIIESHRKKYRDNKYLPIIYPLVLYTGLETYTAPVSLIDLFRDKDLADRLINSIEENIKLDPVVDTSQQISELGLNEVKEVKIPQPKADEAGSTIQTSWREQVQNSKGKDNDRGR